MIKFFEYFLGIDAYKLYRLLFITLQLISGICKRRGVLLVILWLFSLNLFLSNQLRQWFCLTNHKQVSKGRHQKKIENFGGFILKGGRGSPQKPNFCIPLIWDILVRREGVKTWIPKFVCQFYWQNFTHNGVHFFNPSLIFFNFHSILIFIMHDVSLWYDNDKKSKSVSNRCPTSHQPLFKLS